MLCVGVGALAFRSESLDLGGVGGESFDVIACWLVTVTFEPPNTKGYSAVLEFLFCFVAAQEPDFLDKVVNYGYTA
jgi:hypothetical protein